MYELRRYERVCAYDGRAHGIMDGLRVNTCAIASVSRFTVE